MRLFQAALDTPLDSPFSATLSVHGLHFTVPVSPNPLNLRGADSPLKGPKFRGGGSKTPCFKVFFKGRPLNLGRESAPLKLRGFGLTRVCVPSIFEIFSVFRVRRARETPAKGGLVPNTAIDSNMFFLASTPARCFSERSSGGCGSDILLSSKQEGRRWGGVA